MASTCTRLPTPSSSMVTYCVPRFSQVPGRMARVTSSPLPAFARMTEPSHEPGCRPHLSILTDLICPSYTCDVAFEGAPAVTSDARAHASPVHRRQMPAVLSRFIGPPPSLNSPSILPPSWRPPRWCLTLRGSTSTSQASRRRVSDVNYLAKEW